MTRSEALVTLGILILSGMPRPAIGAEPPWPGADWPRGKPADVGLDAAQLDRARKYALTGGGSGCIVRNGRLVMQWGDQRRRYDLKSSTKSIGMTAVGLALADGKIKGLDDKARQYHPSLGVPPAENARTGWLDKITLAHLATQTAGFRKPGGYTELDFAPGTKWRYSDGGPNWLAECITLLYKEDLSKLMFRRVFTPIGVKSSDLTWRNNAYRARQIGGVPRREFGSGISANVHAMARIGYLYLRRGRWKERQIIPERFVAACGRPAPGLPGLPVVDGKAHADASNHYGLLWWNNADGTLKGVPRSAYWSWGLYDSLIVVMPGLDIVAARAGGSWKRRSGAAPYDVLVDFLTPIAAAARPTATPAPAPHPPSPVIRQIRWAPVGSIVRLAAGSDNWPITWADDGDLYTAYGDGRGFAKPRVPRKLSLGLARVVGMPPDIRGLNIRSPTAEQIGDGPRGRKASGMLMVDRLLYMLARNADGKGRCSQLAWSKDHGRTWTWADWKFTTSFGYPTFLNFGRNYAGARDEYVYVYSPDSPSAYRPADRMVLARVAKTRITRRDAYEFFHRLDSKGRPVWTDDITRRGAVFTNPKRCYRIGISHNAPLKRYLWCQILPGGDTRFQGGLAIHDAPEPWGPWTTAFLADRWDTGPGETAGIPPKWISADGKTVHLLFSGNDSFSVRKGTLTLARGVGPR